MLSLLFLLFLLLPIIYIILSFIFLRKPAWIHQRRQPAFIARNIAHRGGAGESIENSFLAFDRGLLNGVEMLELDCHLTKDQQVVVHHDTTLTRTTGQDHSIRDLNYQDLPMISHEVLLYSDSSTMVSGGPTESNADLFRIPLLREVFQRYPTVRINIDVKEDSDELIRQISELIVQYQRQHLTYWGSFSNVVCQKLQAQNPAIVRFCSLREVVGIVIAYWLGFLPFISISAGAFEVPFPGEIFRMAMKDMKRIYKVLFFLIEKALTSRSMFVHLQRRGIPVYVWILNNDDEFHHAFQKTCVTGVMTDYPTRLRTYLLSHRHDFILN